MSIKRGIIVLTTGLAVGTGIFWAVDYYAHLGLVKRITWTDVVAWQNFAAGFITASWLVLWSKFLGLIFKPKKKETAATAKSFVPPATKAPATELANRRRHIYTGKRSVCGTGNGRQCGFCQENWCGSG